MDVTGKAGGGDEGTGPGSGGGERSGSEGGERPGSGGGNGPGGGGGRAPGRGAGKGRRRGGGEDRRGTGQPTHVADALGALLRKHGLEGELQGQQMLARWDEIVGEKIAAVARPSGVARGVLYVEVRSSAWMSELNLMRHEILRRLNAGDEPGRVERILFRLAEDPSSGPTS